MKRQLFIGILIATITGTGWSMEVKQTSEIVLHVKGLVCSFCAYGTSKKLSKLDFVNRREYKKGVFSDIETGYFTLAIKPDSLVDFEEVLEKVEKGGYHLEMIYLKLKGPIEKGENYTTLKHEFTGQVFTLVDLDNKQWDPGTMAGTVGTIQARIPRDTFERESDKTRVYVQVLE